MYHSPWISASDHTNKFEDFQLANVAFISSFQFPLLEFQNGFSLDPRQKV